MNKVVYILIGNHIRLEDLEHIRLHYWSGPRNVSNERYERKLVSGFDELGLDYRFLSAPRVGRFPFSSKKLKVSGFHNDEHLTTVSYLCPFGLIGVFKSRALCKAMRKLLDELPNDADIHVIACEAHRPYLDALAYAKRHAGARKVFSTLIVPDLPEEMMQSKNWIYRLLKKGNIRGIHSLISQYVDSFLCLTSSINESINPFAKPSVVREGIVEMHPYEQPGKHGRPRVVYVGKTDERNGILLIYRCAELLPDLDFHLYGSGDCKVDAPKASNLHIHGYLPPDQVDDVLKDADILLSPRIPEGSYVAHSFPSKVLDYVSHYKPVITFPLPCYPEGLNKVLIYPKEVSSPALASSIAEVSKALDIDAEVYDEILKPYSPKEVASALIGLWNREDER